MVTREHLVGAVVGGAVVLLLGTLAVGAWYAPASGYDPGGMMGYGHGAMGSGWASMGPGWGIWMGLWALIPLALVALLAWAILRRPPDRSPAAADGPEP